jgi:phosphate transport system ATP-binding protein
VILRQICHTYWLLAVVSGSQVKQMTSNAKSDAGNTDAPDAIIRVRGLAAAFDGRPVFRDVSFDVLRGEIFVIAGGSGCGKSTLLRCFNRMNDLTPYCRVKGNILLDGQDIYDGIPLTSLRRRVGMVFQRPNPFPLSVYDNVVYGMRVHGVTKKADLDAAVERSLKASALWDTLKDRLASPALGLSAEQQQRLCISRLVAVEPEVLLMDEPCSALDPIATEHIEELMRELASQYTIVTRQ